MGCLSCPMREVLKTIQAVPKRVTQAAHFGHARFSRKQGYMVGNCAHCHTPEGFAMKNNKVKLDLTEGKLYDFNARAMRSIHFDFASNKLFVNTKAFVEGEGNDGAVVVSEQTLRQSYLYLRVSASPKDRELLPFHAMPMHTPGGSNCRLVNLTAKWILSQVPGADPDGYTQECEPLQDFQWIDLDSTESPEWQPRRADWNTPEGMPEVFPHSGTPIGERFCDYGLMRDLCFLGNGDVKSIPTDLGFLPDTIPPKPVDAAKQDAWLDKAAYNAGWALYHYLKEDALEGRWQPAVNECEVKFGVRSEALGPSLLLCPCLFRVFCFDLFLQLHEAVNDGFRCRRAAWNIHIHGDDAVDALHHVVGSVKATRRGASAHGEHPLGLAHLIVDALENRCHFFGDGARHQEKVGLAGRETHHLRSKAGEVVFWAHDRHELDAAAGRAKGVGPQTVPPGPGDELVDLRRDEEFVAVAVMLHEEDSRRTRERQKKGESQRVTSVMTQVCWHCRMKDGASVAQGAGSPRQGAKW